MERDGASLRSLPPRARTGPLRGPWGAADLGAARRPAGTNSVMEFKVRIPFVESLGFELIRFERDEAEIAMQLREEMTNSWVSRMAASR